MAIDKTKAARRSGKSLTTKNKKEKATADYQTIAEIEAMRPQALNAISDALILDVKADGGRQKIAATVMRMHWIYSHTKQNAYVAPTWKEMILPDRKISLLGKAFTDRVKMDVLGKAPPRKSKGSSLPTFDQKEASREYKNKNEALLAASRLAIACGYFGGTIEHWDDKLNLLMVSADVFRPVFTNSRAAQWTFKYRMKGGGFFALDGSNYYMERELPDHKVDEAMGKLSMRQALLSFYATPKTGTADTTQGADQARLAQYDEPTRKGVLASTRFEELVIQAAERLSAEHNGKPDPSLFIGKDGIKLSVAIDTIIAYRIASTKAKRATPKPEITIKPEAKPAITPTPPLNVHVAMGIATSPAPTPTDTVTDQPIA